MKPRRAKANAQKFKSRNRKFRVGAPITSLEGVWESLRCGRWLMWNGRPMHPEFIRSMTLRGIERGVLAGVVCRAEVIANDAPLPLPFDREFIEAMQQ